MYASCWRQRYAWLWRQVRLNSLTFSTRAFVGPLVGVETQIFILTQKFYNFDLVGFGRSLFWWSFAILSANVCRSCVIFGLTKRPSVQKQLQLGARDMCIPDPKRS